MTNVYMCYSEPLIDVMADLRQWTWYWEMFTILKGRVKEFRGLLVVKSNVHSDS